MWNSKIPYFSAFARLISSVDNYSLSAEQYRVPKMRRTPINSTHWKMNLSQWAFVILEKSNKNLHRERSERLKVVLKKSMSGKREQRIMKSCMKHRLQCWNIETDAIQYTASHSCYKIQTTGLSERVDMKTCTENGPSRQLFLWGVEFISSKL